MVFVLKVYAPHGSESFSPFWRMIAHGVEYFVRVMGIPKSIAVCWEERVNYLDHAPTGVPLEATKGKIRVVFNNVAVTVYNLPRALGAIFKQAAQQQEANRLLSKNEAAGEHCLDKLFDKIGNFLEWANDSVTKKKKIFWDDGTSEAVSSCNAKMNDSSELGVANTGGVGNMKTKRGRRASLSFEGGDDEDLAPGKKTEGNFEVQRMGTDLSGSILTLKFDSGQIRFDSDANLYEVEY